MKKQVVALCLGCLCLAASVPFSIAADQVAVGAEHTTVLRSDGTVWGVGRNHYGQLGDGTTNQRLRLVQALLPVKATALCSGDNHLLALDENGEVWGWGYNSSGQLGLGNSQPTNRPTKIPNLTDVIGIGAGGNYSFAIHRDGSLYAWGQNNQGQLGLGVTSSSTNRPTLLTIPGFQIIQADGGTMHTLILATNAAQETRLYTCGMNNDGQLGLGYTGSYSNRLTWISSLSDVRGVCAGGNSSMVVLTNGNVYVWGNNINGQLGLGGSTSTSSPTRIPAFSNVVGLACGPYHILLNLNNGSIYGCGMNDSAQLGIDYFLNIFSPMRMTDPSNVVFTSIGAGNNHSAALDEQGGLWTWGLNNFGQLGDGFTSLAMQPTPALTSGEALSIACGLHHVLTLESPDRLSSWGENTYGQLGDGTTASRSHPEQAAIGFSRIVCGQNHSLAISNGQLYAWGRSSSGQLGLGYVGDQSLPVRVDLPMTIAGVGAGDTFSFAILTNGQLMSWGDNNSGQLGIGHTQRAYYPTNVGRVSEPMMEVAQVAGGGAHTLAAKTNGSAWAWGYNTFGQLGDGGGNNTNLPIAILPGIFTNVIQVAAGGYHSLFLHNSEVWSCGYNGLGQLGLLGSSATSTPTRIVELSNVTAVACGSYHSLALLADHSVWAWGDNNYGQLGNSVKGNTSLPTRVSLLTNAVFIAAHDNVSAAIENDRIYVWGTDEYGQIGNNHRRWTPFNADTIFAGIAQAGGDCRLRWNTGKQAVYQVFCITNLMSETWLSLGWVTSSAYAVDFPVTNGLPGFFAVQQQ